MKVLFLAMASLISAPALVLGMSKLTPAKPKQSSRGVPPHHHPTAVNDHLRKLGNGYSWEDKLDEGDWNIKEEIKPGNDLGFGWQVAITDDSETMIVGSYYSGLDGCNSTDVATYGTGGSARVFTRSTNLDSSTDWTEQGLLIGDDGAGGKYGGYAVEIDGDTAIVSAFKLPCIGNVRIFIFVRDDAGIWTQQEMLHTEYDGIPPASGPPIPRYYDDGRVPRVAIKGDTAVVGRPLANEIVNSAGLLSQKGDAIVYVRNGTTWSMQTHLEATDGVEGDFFGADVDISSSLLTGDTIIVGATQEKLDSASARRGKAYVFKRSGTSWSQDATLYPGDDVYRDFMFGSSVALDNTTAVVGHARRHPWPVPAVDDAGIVYAHVFQYAAVSGSWPLQAKLEHPNEEPNEDKVWGDHGSVVAIKGDLALVGDGRPWGAILYERTGSTWAAKQLLNPLKDGGALRDLGNSRKLALTADTAIMAVDQGFGIKTEGIATDGSVYVFDNFSYMPLGPLDTQWLHSAIFETGEATWGAEATFLAGYGRDYELDLLQGNCETPINDTEIHTKSERAIPSNFTHVVIVGRYDFNTTTIFSSSIFDMKTSTITLCARFRLLDSAGVVQKEIKKVVSGFIGSSSPSMVPSSSASSGSPTNFPSDSPTSSSPSMVPSSSASSGSPTNFPSDSPTSSSPSMVPSGLPTTFPSVSMAPSGSPTTEAFGNARGAFNPNPSIDGSTELVVSVPTKAVLSPSTCTADTPLSDTSFINKVELQLKSVGCIAETKNPADIQCKVKISKMECQTSRRQLVRGQRNLQTSSLLIDFSTTITAYCQKGDCSDAQSIIDGIYNTVKLQLDESLNANPDFLAGYINTQLNTNIFASTLAVSSTVTFGSVIVPILEDLLKWYPDWNSESNFCKNDGQYPLYMKRQGSYFQSSLADCCEKYYSWAYSKCLELGGGDAGAIATDEFYADYSKLSCVQDCPKDTSGKNCGGLVEGNWVGTYKTAKECCDGKLWWVDENTCIAQSTKDASDLNVAQAGSGKYYVHWGEAKCVKDCAETPTDPQCGGLAERWDPLFNSANSCCSSKLSYIDRSECTR